MIWLIGNKGMLGTELSMLLKKSGILFIGTDREVDIIDHTALKNFARAHTTHTIDWIINCAAYTAVDKAEGDIENCRLLNTEGPRNIARVAKINGARLIHLSTDYVFNGQRSTPYTEEDATNPIGIYGLTKRDGEIKLLEENEKSYIIRTAWLYGKYGNNFVHSMLRLMKEQESVSVINNQRGSPTWTRILAETIIKLIQSTAEGKTIPYGIYHYTNEGEITWFDFAKEIHAQAYAFGILAKACKIVPCSDFPAKVKRPAYSLLDKTKIKNALEATIPPWNESLREFLCDHA